MSYHGGGNRRKQYRGEDNIDCAEGNHLNSCTSSGGDDYDQRRETFETPEQKLRKSIINLGEVVRSFQLHQRMAIHRILRPSGPRPGTFAAGK